MSLVRRLVLGAILLVVASFVLLHRAEGQTSTQLFGSLAMILLLAVSLAFAIGLLFAGRLAELTTAVRQMTIGMPPRLPKVGVIEIDALTEAVRQLHTDVTGRVQTLQGEQRDATAIIDSMAEGVIATDVRGRVTIANPAARRMLGYAGDAPLPLLSALFRTKSARAAIDEVLAGDLVRDREVEMDDQTLILNARPLADRGVVVVMHDLTAVRRLETVRSDFIANASHELKTPLTSIAGYAETLVADNGEMDEGTRRRFLETLHANARRMQHLVDDLLNLSRIESGRWHPNPETVDLTAVARECWQLLSDKAAAAQVTLVLTIAEDAAQLTADPETLRQILGNLFDNAIRYVPPGGTVRVRTERLDGGLVLSVEDTGSGISSEHLPRIFERFYRVDPSRSRDEGGTGLGLAIVRHLVETQGGRVWAESVLREGTAIRAWFPVL